MSNADELMVSEKTAYNYLNAGLFDADGLSTHHQDASEAEHSKAENRQTLL